jgi:YNFM family putative membrane transporter
MYATQPLQPLLANEFNISVIKASQFTAIIMLFLGVAPLIYGYILESFSAKKMLYISFAILFFTNLALALSDSFNSFMFFRIIEALLIPAILTSIMSIMANIDKQNIKYNMALYVAATVFAGLTGRVVSGYIATGFGWQSVFYFISTLMLLSIFLIHKLSFEGDTNLVKPKPSDIRNILKDTRFIIVYLLMFCMFFVFSGVLNILPFRMKELDPSMDEAKIGLLYLGYGTGIIVALFSKQLIKLLKAETNMILLGGIIYLLSTLLLLSSSYIFTFSMIFFFCIGMFMVHTISTGLANSMKASQKSLTSGMYLTAYYIGGFTGSTLLAFVYHGFGWENTLYVCACLLVFVFGLFLKFRNILH